MSQALGILPRRWFDWIILAWIILVSTLIFGLMTDYAFDDPFITYRYAINLATGHGFVYNPDLRVLSTTAPLYALILSPFARLGLPLPPVSILLGSLSLGAGALAIWRMALLSTAPIAGMIAVLLFPLTPLLLTTLGAETVPFIALVLWGMLLAWQRYPGTAGIVLALATLIRADAALAVALVGLFITLRDGLKPGLRFSLICLLLITPAVLATWWYFGSPLPATLGAKRSQAAIEGSRGFLAGLGSYLLSLGRNPGFWPLLALAPIGLIVALVRRGPLSLVVLWSGLHVIAYSLLGVTAYFWYFGPAMTGLVVAAALATQWCADQLTHLMGRRATAALIAVGTTIILFSHLQSLIILAQRNDPRLQVYRPVGLWLAANTPPKAQVGTLEVGMIGFYAERPMIDFAGLIQPDVAAVFRAGGDYRAAAHYALEHYQPAYLVNQEALLPLVHADPVLASSCQEVATFPDPRVATPLQIFYCQWE